MTEKEFNDTILPLTKDIYTFALHLTGHPANSEDLTQDVMFKLWGKRKELKKLINPKAWALKITRNLYLDQLKKHKPTYDESEVIRNGGYDRDLLQQIEAKDQAEAVKQIIATLPAIQKEVMVLREIEELEYEEIAEITGLGLNNIRVLLSRGRMKVKEILVNKYQISYYEG